MKKLYLVKRVASVMLASMLVAGALSACGGNSNTQPAATQEEEAGDAEETAEEATDAAEAGESFASLEGAAKKIAVATIHEGETWEIQRKYFEEEVGPAFNMEFMFSEKLSDANGLVDFMDQAYAAGCEGCINFVTSKDASAQGARKAEEWGMWFVTQNSALNEDIVDLQYNLGHCGASAQGMGEGYAKAFSELLSDGEPHSVVIFSGAAVGGAIGQGAASHYYSVEGILKTFQDTYGLNFEKSIDDIINTQDPGEVAHDNNDIHIYIYPGLDVQAATTAVQTQLQTGNYDIFAAVFSYSAFVNAIDGVEQASGNNIKIVATASIEDQTATGFTTQDSTGDSILNAAVINPLNNANAMNAIALFNAFNGNPDAVKRNGQAQLFGVLPWVCMDAATYEGIGKLDKDHATYVMNSDDLFALCGSSVTADDIDAKLTQLGDIDSIIAEKLN